MASTLQNIYRKVALSNAPDLVATGAQTIVGWNLINPIATAAYLKIYNAAAASDVTVGTTVPIETLLIPPGPGLFFLSNEDKYQMGCNLGIVVAVTTGISDTDNSAPATGCYVKILYTNSN